MGALLEEAKKSHDRSEPSGRPARVGGRLGFADEYGGGLGVRLVPVQPVHVDAGGAGADGPPPLPDKQCFARMLRRRYFTKAAGLVID